MVVFINGRFVPAARAVVSVFDRGLLYGDGLFETMRVVRGTPFQWDEHYARFARGAALLKICLPAGADKLRRVAARLIELNALPDSVLRLLLTRGTGPRGYSTKGATSPTLILSLHEAPPLATKKLPRARLITSTVRLPAGDPLAQVKTCNKLPCILARAEADAAGADDALLLNTRGHLAEATASNLFWIARGELFTPPLRAGALDGITRATVLRLCPALGLRAREKLAAPPALHRAAGVFLTNSVTGIVEVRALDGKPLKSSPLVACLRQAWSAMLQ